MTMRVLLIGSLWLLVGCDSFLVPPVACPTRQLINLRQTVTLATGTRFCTSVDTAFAVSYAPRFDRTVLGQDGQPANGPDDDAQLIGTRVRVSRGVAATFLCSAPSGDCGDRVPEYQTRIGTDGRLAYQGLFSLEGFDLALSGGDQFTWEGTVLTESFGPGNSCEVTGRVEVSCTAPMVR